MLLPTLKSHLHENIFELVPTKLESAQTVAALNDRLGQRFPQILIIHSPNLGGQPTVAHINLAGLGHTGLLVKKPENVVGIAPDFE